MPKNAECVKVMVRCRPFNGRETSLGCKSSVEIDSNTNSVQLYKPNSKEVPKRFTYDSVYDGDSKQSDIYNETAFPLVESVLEGYNGTIFAYGQTG